MALFEDRTQAFILRFWQEPREQPDAAPEWRGAIEHVRSGDRRYFKSLDELVNILNTYLAAFGLVDETPR